MNRSNHGIEAIQDPEFAKLTTIGHAFFTRKGGVSEGFLASLNCSDTAVDNPEHVTENRRRALEYLDLPIDALITVNNVHGSDVAVIKNDYQDLVNLPVADAMVTQLKNRILASDSADCPIVLFADEQAQVIGLAHAGWRGAKLGIIERTVEQMVLLGANQNNICAVISPCITQDSYEVSHEFQQQFLLDHIANHTYFKPSEKQGHVMFDLLGFVKDKLIKLDLKLVTAIGLDTYANEDLFFSCRRAYHRGEPGFGGQLSAIYQK